MFLEIKVLSSCCFQHLAARRGGLVPSSESVTEHQGQLELLREAHGKHDGEGAGLINAACLN